MQIVEAKTLCDATDAIAEAADALSAFGSLRYIKSLTDRDSLMTDFLHYYFVGRLQNAVSQ